MFESKKTQILIAHQKEGIDRTKKSTATRQKKFLCKISFLTLRFHNWRLQWKKRGLLQHGALSFLVSLLFICLFIYLFVVIFVMWPRVMASRSLRAHNKYTSTRSNVTIFITKSECSLRHLNKNWAKRPVTAVFTFYIPRFTPRVKVIETGYGKSRQIVCFHKKK